MTGGDTNHYTNIDLAAKRLPRLLMPGFAWLFIPVNLSIPCHKSTAAYADAVEAAAAVSGAGATSSRSLTTRLRGAQPLAPASTAITVHGLDVAEAAASSAWAGLAAAAGV